MNDRHGAPADVASVVLDAAIEATRRFTMPSDVPVGLLERAKRLTFPSAQSPAVSAGVPVRSLARRSWLPQIALSLAALAASGIFVTGSFGHRSVAFAEVVEAMKHIKAARFAVRITGLNGPGDEQSGIWFETDTGISRTEYTDTVFLLDARRGRMMMLRSQDKVAVSSPFTPDQGQPMSGGPMEAFRREIAAAKPAGREPIDGIDTEIFIVTGKSTTDTYWIDPSTRLPVRMQTRQRVMGREVIVSADRFEWNVDIDPALTEFRPPAGYRSVEIEEGEGVPVDDEGRPVWTEKGAEEQTPKPPAG